MLPQFSRSSGAYASGQSECTVQYIPFTSAAVRCLEHWHKVWKTWNCNFSLFATLLPMLGQTQGHKGDIPKSARKDGVMTKPLAFELALSSVCVTDHQPMWSDNADHKQGGKLEDRVHCPCNLS